MKLDKNLVLSLLSQILVNNALVGIVIGLALALVVLTVATTNVIVGAMATLTIAMVTCSVLAIIPIIGWKLGLFESLNLTLIVGLAVDYVVHLAEGYMELEDQDRLTRVRHTLGRVGISVFSGACTTLGASIFMLAAKIVFFSQFGIFIFCTIGFSILYSLFLFITVLALIGPEGQTGSLIPLVRKVKNFVRGKKKNQVDCATCQGKGFHDKDLNTGVINAPQVTRF